MLAKYQPNISEQVNKNDSKKPKAWMIPFQPVCCLVIQENNYDKTK